MYILNFIFLISKAQKIDANQRELIAKIRNCIKLLDEEFIDITIENITELYDMVTKQNLQAK